MSKRLHNPKSYSPAVYIPCWLAQVSIQLLSHGAKMCYGRLTQWANSKGKVYRSCNQLSEEIGASVGSIEKYLKELKDVGLIGTHHPQAGGVNHFEFYDHEWMHLDIKEQLLYKEDPPPNPTVPPVRSYGTPPPDSTDINIKEIKELNTHTQAEDFPLETMLFLESEQQRIAIEFRKRCLADEKLKRKHEQLQSQGFDKTFDDVLDECVSHYATQQKPQLVSPQRLQSWLNRDISYFKTQEIKEKVGSKRDRPGDAYTRAMKMIKSSRGNVYDQQGNSYDPFS